MWSKKFILLIIAAFICVVKLHGQVAKSPFSSFGLGELYNNQPVHAQGMGGVGIANPQYWYLNNQNPAALPFNRLTTLTAGYVGERKTISDNNLENESYGGNLNYFIMSFPVKSTKWTTALGLSPYSNVNYTFKYEEPIEGSTNSIQVTESGSGGFNQFYMSHGYSITDEFSVGLKTGFLFSSIINEYANTLTQTEQIVSYAPAIYERTSLRDLTFNLGFLYHKDSISVNNYRFSIGLVYDHASNMRANRLERIELRTPSNTLIESDTLTFNNQGSITLPRGLGFGVALSKGYKWTIAADVYLHDWSQYRNFEGSNEGLNNSLSIALGAEVTPDQTSLGNYLNRVTYRTGLNYSESPYLINGESVKDFGINFGLSFPTAQFSSLDLAFKVGRRGNRDLTDLQENYFKIYFGVTFNDRWFIKRRFD
jgi:long-subunit fatty acid transport protein